MQNTGVGRLRLGKPAIEVNLLITMKIYNYNHVALPSVTQVIKFINFDLR